MKRILFAATLITFCIALTMPRGSAAPMQKDKGGGNKTISVVQMTLHDEIPNTTLLSDGMVRAADGPDSDTIGDLTGPFVGLPIVYQDSRIDDSEPGATFPDPCSLIEPSRALLDPQACSQSDPDFTDEARTYSLVFESFGNDGPGCACDELSYLITTDQNGNPVPALMYSVDPINGQPAVTGFVDNRDANGVGECVLSLAAGKIVTDATNNNTASQQIRATPFDLPPNKQRGGKKANLTDVEFNFHTDKELAEARRDYQLVSQGDNIKITNPDDPDDAGARILTANGTELFDLKHAFSSDLLCVGIPMTFKISYQLFEVPR